MEPFRYNPKCREPAPALGGAVMAGATLLASSALLLFACNTTPTPPARHDAVSLAASRLDRDAATLAPALASQAWTPGTPLTMEAAIADALSQDPAVRAALARLDAATARVDQASRLPNPMLDLIGGVPLGDMGVAPYGLMVAQQLSFLWTLERREAIATADLRAATMDVAAALVSAALDARAQYITAWTAIEVARLTDATLAHARRVEAAIHHTVGAGLRPASDLAEPIAMRAGLEARAASIDAQAVEAQVTLLRLMGASDAALPSLSVPVEVTPLYDARLPDAEALCRDAAQLDANLSILAAKARVESAAARLGLDEASRWDSVSLSAGRERDMAGDSAWMFGLSIELPIFDDGSPAIAVAKAELDAARLDAEAARQDVVARLRRAGARFGATRGGVAAAEAASAASSLAAAADERDVSEGLTPPMTALQGLIARDLDLTALTSARAAEALARIDIERARLGTKVGTSSGAAIAASTLGPRRAGSSAQSMEIMP
ncbi:MAG: TolC family protein [Planctomycetota bacterium]|nr:TolC family protein [Planctomycetota bacterium]MDA1106260.1 TolC family protein [Planctomycetota bacterium]